MARNTQNVLVTQNDRGGHRETAGNAPAVETANARVHTIGPFRKANLAASLSATAMSLGGVDADAPTQQLAHSSGRIIGVIAQANATVTAGGTSAITVQPQVAPAGVTMANAGSAATLPGGGANPPTTVADQSTTTVNGVTAQGVAFAKGDGLGVTVATSAGLLPSGSVDLAVWLVVRYDASPGVPA